MPAIFTTPVFDSWFKPLRDRRAAARIQARIDRGGGGEPGWLQAGRRRSLGDADRRRPRLTRVYFFERGVTVVILLAGGEKSTQAKDIAAAQELAKRV